MAGPAKKRAQGEKQAPGAVSSDTQPSSGDRSTPKSIPRMDGNRDPGIPEGKAPMEYSNEKDLKNIGSALGLAGWCVANGVSAEYFVLSYRNPLLKRNQLETSLAAGSSGPVSAAGHRLLSDMTHRTLPDPLFISSCPRGYIETAFSPSPASKPHLPT